MISLLLSLIFILVIFAIFWWILTQIPIPPQFRWIVNVVVGLIFLICLIELFLGGINLFPHTVLR